MKKIEIESVEIAGNALGVANERMGIVSSGEIPFNALTETNIPIRLADLLLKKSQANTADSNSIEANANYDIGMEKLRKYENSFFTIIFLKIKDGIYPPSILTSFDMATTDRALPYNLSDVACVGLVAKMETGNLQIIALGLPLMVDYNYAQANTYLGDVEVLKGTKITMEGLANTADTALVTSYNLAKPLVENMQAQEDLFFIALKDGALRDALSR